MDSSSLTANSPCPCRSGNPYGHCCQPLHQGQPANTPEALMRSRFSAFALKNERYVLRSWHPTTRPASLSFTADEHWLGLTVFSQHANGDEGQVHFRAVCKTPSHWEALEETSRFLREAGHWFYVDGNTAMSRLDIGRNSPCPCGSGKKNKRCCG